MKNQNSPTRRYEKILLLMIGNNTKKYGFLFFPQIHDKRFSTSASSIASSNSPMYSPALSPNIVSKLEIASRKNFVNSFQQLMHDERLDFLERQTSLHTATFSACNYYQRCWGSESLHTPTRHINIYSIKIERKVLIYRTMFNFHWPLYC